MSLELNEVDQAVKLLSRKHLRLRHLLAALKNESVRLKVLVRCFHHKYGQPIDTKAIRANLSLDLDNAG